MMAAAGKLPLPSGKLVPVSELDPTIHTPSIYVQQFSR